MQTTTTNAAPTAPTAAISVEDYSAKMQAWTAQELEAFCRRYQNRKHNELSDNELRELLAAMRLHRRSTAGPPKAKGKVKPAPLDIKSLF